DDTARDRRRLQERRVRPRGGPQRGRRRPDRRDHGGPSHSSGRPPPSGTSAARASTTAAPATASAMIARVELPPEPPSDDTASTRGAGVSEDSGLVQSATDPSVQVGG